MHHVPFMLRALRPILGALLAVCFSANALAPGMLHGCESGVRASAGEVAAPAGHAEHGAAHHAAAGAPAGHEHGAPAQGPGPGCHCVGHACCVVALALPAPTTLRLEVQTPTMAPASTREATPIAIRLDRLLPFAQAPPA